MSLHAQEVIRVAGLTQEGFSLACGSNQGVKVGITGRVFFQEKVEGKLIKIFIASFRVSKVEATRCQAQILEKKREVAVGDLVVFDQPLKAPAGTAGNAQEKTYSLSISTVPEDAEIYINGNKLGRGPLKLDLISPDCEVRIEKEGFTTIEDSFTVLDGGMSKNYNLEPTADARTAPVQKNESFAVPGRMSLDEIEKNISKARSTRTWGWILMVPTVLWTGFCLAGFIAFLVDSKNTDDEWVMLTAIPTSIISIVGFIMVLIGNSNAKRYRKMKTDLRLGLDIRPDQKRYGVTFSWVF
jgi:hypothetical protein